MRIPCFLFSTRPFQALFLTLRVIETRAQRVHKGVISLGSGVLGPVSGKGFGIESREQCGWGQNGMGERPIEVDGRERSKAGPSWV